MTPTTTAVGMAKRVLISALAGILVGAVLVDPVITVLYQHCVIHNDYWLTIGRLEAIGILLERSPGMAILGSLVASPLVAIAVAAGLLFRKQIDRHPLIWTSVAPVLIWLLTCAVFALPDDSQTWLPHRGFPIRMLGVMHGSKRGKTAGNQAGAVRFRTRSGSDAMGLPLRMASLSPR